MYMIRVGNPTYHAIIDDYRRAVDNLESVGEYNREFYEAQLQVARVKLSSLLTSERGSKYEVCDSDR